MLFYKFKNSFIINFSLSLEKFIKKKKSVQEYVRKIFSEKTYSPPAPPPHFVSPPLTKQIPSPLRFPPTPPTSFPTPKPQKRGSSEKIFSKKGFVRKIIPPPPLSLYTKPVQFQQTPNLQAIFKQFKNLALSSNHRHFPNDLKTPKKPKNNPKINKYFFTKKNNQNLSPRPDLKTTFLEPHPYKNFK